MTLRGAEARPAVHALAPSRLDRTPARFSDRFSHLSEQFRPGGEFGINRIPHLELFSLFGKPRGSPIVGKHEYQHAIAAWSHFVPVYGMYIGEDTGWAAVGKASDSAMQEILSAGSIGTGGGASDYFQSGLIDRKRNKPFGSSFFQRRAL